MNLEFSVLGALIIASWALTLSFDSIFVIIISALVFFSKSVPISLLFLLSLNGVAFIQATLGGKKSENGRTQKRYGIVFLGIFCALVGSAVTNPQWSYPLMFLGLLLSIANSVSSFLFYAHYESLSLKAFLQSVIIPAFVAIDVLLKIKAGVKGEDPELWDVTLSVIGLSTYLLSSLLALSKRRVKSALIYISQAWIGLLLFLLIIDSPTSSDKVFAAFAISTLVSLALLQVSAKLGGKYFAFAKAATFALPGAVGFSALYFAIRLSFGLNSIWLLAIAIGYIIQAVTLIGARPVQVEANRRTQIRFWITSFVQFSTGVFLFWLDRGGFK